MPMIARIKTMTPSSACHYYTSGRDYEVLTPRWSGKLAQVLGIDDQPINQACLEQLTKGRNPHGEILVDKTRVHRRQEVAIAAGRKPQKERAGEDLVLNAPKSISLEILVFGNRDLEIAHQLANARTLQIVEERYARTRISESGHQVSVATQSLIFAQFDHGTNRRIEPHRHTHNLILNLQQSPYNQQWQTFDNAALRSAEKWIGQIYRNELAYLTQAMGYHIQITHPDGRWELSGFSSNQLRAFSQRTIEIEDAAGMNATVQQKQIANTTTRPAKSDSISVSHLEREWQRQAAEIGLQQTHPTVEITEQNARSQQQAMTQFLMWLNQTFDRQDRSQHIRSPCREEIEQFSLRSPGRFSFQELQQAIDRYCPPLHSGAFSHYVQRSSAANCESQPSTTDSISSEREYGCSATESRDISKRNSQESVTSECDAFSTEGFARSESSSLTTPIATPSNSADEHTLFFYSFNGFSSFENSSDTHSSNTTHFEQSNSEQSNPERSNPEQSISGCGTPSTPTKCGNSPAGRGTEATPNAPDTTDATNGGTTDQYCCHEEAPRTNGNQQRIGSDPEAIESRPGSFDRQQTKNDPRSASPDYSHPHRHQEESEPVPHPEVAWLEASQLEVER